MGRVQRVSVAVAPQRADLQAAWHEHSLYFFRFQLSVADRVQGQRKHFFGQACEMLLLRWKHVIDDGLGEGDGPVAECLNIQWGYFALAKFGEMEISAIQTIK